jgi:hypothetical protein
MPIENAALDGRDVVKGRRFEQQTRQPDPPDDQGPELLYQFSRKVTHRT